MLHAIFACLGRRGRSVSLVLCAAASTMTSAATVDMAFANLHNPYFSDRLPASAAGREAASYVLAPAPSRYFGIEGDTVAVPFTVVSSSAHSAVFSAELSRDNVVLARLGLPAPGDQISLFRALDVRVEGNSNANCSCPADGLPQTSGSKRVCVEAAAAEEQLTPRGCPNAEERRKTAAVLIRRAPFSIKDALEPVADPATPVSLSAGTELFVLDVPISGKLPKGDLRLRITVKPADGEAKTADMPLRVLSLRLEQFPSLDLSYWMSEDPRDLVARPDGVPLNGRWGGEWWGSEHWGHLERAARLLAGLGVTNTLVPLFVRSPFGIDAQALIPVRCITGDDVAPTDTSAVAERGRPPPLNAAIASWRFEFDFARFQRWVSIFKAAGFRRFEGAHLFANGGKLPAVLECDLYTNRFAPAPYARRFQFLPVSRDGAESESEQRLRESIYRESFLPTFLPLLEKEIAKAGIAGQYWQHVIDENASTDEAVAAYAAGAELVHKYLRGVQTIDAINKYEAPRYASLLDIPVMHLFLIYDDQVRRGSIRKEIDALFPGRKYFYNTALRAGGPNRFLDTNPLDSRVHGWLALETGYDGFLYWAANVYRYPVVSDYSATGRSPDWSPYLFSQGPRPGGFVAPAYGAGGNWLLYPAPAGLTDSLRARRLRDGLLDHWLYLRAWRHCEGANQAACRAKLIAAKARLTRDPSTIADFSRDPGDYDSARELMIGILEN